MAVVKLTQTQQDSIRYKLVGLKINEGVAYQFVRDIQVYGWREALQLLESYVGEYITAEQFQKVEGAYRRKLTV